MRYLVSNNLNPLIYISSGKFLGKSSFVQTKRRLDSFVIYFCIEGVVYITQNQFKYTLKENQYIILFAGHEHKGYQESGIKTSFYWCHFTIEGDYRIFDKSELQNLFSEDASSSFHRSDSAETDILRLPVSGYYILPEYGEVSSDARTLLLIRQLLDFSRRTYYSSRLPSYALSLLAMEISQEYVEKTFINTGKFNPKMESVIEWLRINYNNRLSLKRIAKVFRFNHIYLSAAFRKYKSIPLMKYITMIRIGKAKELLLNSALSIKEIAFQVGYQDEKVFMKRFKKIEEITPTQFRNAFSRVKVNKA